MSYREAQEDGIRIARGYGGTYYYYPSCYICGKEARSINYIRSNRYTCRECKEKAAIQKISKKVKESSYEFR